MNEGFPTGRCRHCGETFYISCPCGGVEGARKREVAQDRAIDLLLAKDLSVPGRSEAALRRLSRAVA